MSKALYYFELAAQMGHPNASDEISNLLDNENRDVGADAKKGKSSITTRATVQTKCNRRNPKELSPITLQTLRLSSSSS